MRFSVAAALTVPVMVLGMSDHLGLHVPRPVSLWLQLLLTTPVQFWAGWQFYRGAWAVARHGTTDMNTLIALGTSAAYRSEEHTSELQSLRHLVCRLLLEKKKKKQTTTYIYSDS